MSESKFPSAREAREAGWYSRRHETKESHDAMMEKYPHKKKKKQ